MTIRQIVSAVSVTYSSATSHAGGSNASDFISLSYPSAAILTCSSPKVRESRTSAARPILNGRNSMTGSSGTIRVIVDSGETLSHNDPVWPLVLGRAHLGGRKGERRAGDLHRALPGRPGH